VYDHLVGTPIHRSPGRLVLRCGGVGYELATPLSARFAGEQDEGAETLVVHTHLVVREDAQLLYGFPDQASRDTFRLLLGAQRVGPAIALALLAQLSRRVLLEALVAGDVQPLLVAKGVGRRIADQILLDLKDKAARLLAEDRAAEGGAAASALDPRARAVEDAVTALLSIGYSEKDARKAVELAAKRSATSDVQALIRDALTGR
jgi:Holliday junction DNA helicase RuvA